MPELPKKNSSDAESLRRFAEITTPTFVPHQFLNTLTEVFKMFAIFKENRILDIPLMSDQIEQASAVIAQHIRADERFRPLELQLIFTQLIGQYESFQTRIDMIKAELLVLFSDYAEFQEKALHATTKQQCAAVKAMATSFEADLPNFVEMVGVKQYCEQHHTATCKCKYRGHAWCMKNVARDKAASLHDFDPSSFDADIKQRALAEVARVVPFLTIDANFHILNSTQPITPAVQRTLQETLAPFVCEQLKRRDITILERDILDLKLKPNLGDEDGV